MPTPEQMIAAVHTYVEAFDKGDVDMAVGIFADDATVEDPIGTPPHAGREAIHAFYAASMKTGAKLTLTGPLRVAAAHVAFPFQVSLNWQGRDMVIEVIDTFAFNDAGKVSRMQAFFGPSNMGGTR